METNAPLFAYPLLASVLENKQDFVKALSLYERWERLMGRKVDQISAKYNALRAAQEVGSSAYWRKRIQIAEQEQDDPYDIACFYLQTGNFDKAFAWLDKALADHSGTLLSWVRTEPALQALRTDRRYAELLEKMDRQGSRPGRP